MNILVVNAGSSSIKYQLIDMPSGVVKCVGLVERIGFKDAIFSHEKGDEKHQEILSIL
jgi:acetate kinase